MENKILTADILVAGAILILSIGLGAGLLVPGVVGLFHDDAIYVATAKGIVERGRYLMPFLPGEVPHCKYPPLFPLLLAGVWYVFPDFPENVLYFEILSLLLCGLSLSLAYFLLVSRGYVSRVNAVLGLLLVLTSHLYLYYGSVAMSEMLFSCLLIASLYYFDSLSAAPGKGSLQKFFTCGVLLGLACLTRSAGIFFLPAFILALIRSRARLICFIFGVVLTYGPWILWSGHARKSVQNPEELAYYLGYLSWIDTLFGIFHRVAIYNFTETIFIFPLAFFESFSWFFEDKSGAWLVVLLAGLLGIAGWSSTFKTKRFVTLAPLSYLVLVNLWPGQPIRMIVPLLPILIPICLEGTGTIIQKLKYNSYLQLGVRAFLGFAILANILKLGDYRTLVGETKIPYLEIPKTGEEVTWADYQIMLNWISDHASSSDIIASTIDPIVYLYTGRRSVMPALLEPGRWIYNSGEPPYGTDQEILAHLDKVEASYVMLVPLPADASQWVLTRQFEAISKDHPDKIQKVFQGVDARYVVYRYFR